MISNSVWNETGSWPLGSQKFFFFVALLTVEWVCAGGQRQPAALFAGDRWKVNEHHRRCRLPFWGSGKTEGDYSVPVSPIVIWKRIVRERSVEPHLSLVSWISLFMFLPHALGSLPTTMQPCVHVCARMQTANACSLNFHIYAIEYIQ